MKELIIDGSRIQDREALHDALASLFDPWYGRNLDALYDCLTQPQEALQITLLDLPTLEKGLGPYCRTFLQVLKDAAAENPALHITINTQGEETDHE